MCLSCLIIKFLNFENTFSITQPDYAIVKSLKEKYVYYVKADKINVDGWFMRSKAKYMSIKYSFNYLI